MQTRQIGNGGPTSSALGLGCMGMSSDYGSAESRDPEEALRTLDAAIELGITHLDTAEVYGPYTNEELLGRAIRGRRERLTLATKFGFRFSGPVSNGLDGSPANARRACEASLKRLGVDYLDLFYLHRLDPTVPIEDSVGAMAELVRAGKVRHLGLSEVGAATLRRAVAVHPIAALQSEYSLFERGIERDILPACRALGIGLVAFCPLGRGFLTGAVARAEDYAASDFRSQQPRFQGSNYDHNQALVAGLARLAVRKGCSSAQLALAWLLAQGKEIVPIPGTRRRTHLADNAGAVHVTLSSCDLMSLEELFPRGAVAGARYAPEHLAWIER